jgi:hypothetical protein
MTRLDIFIELEFRKGPEVGASPEHLALNFVNDTLVS